MSKPPPLNELVKQFFERRLRGESIDHLPEGQKAGLQKADYLILQRGVVVEQKELLDTREDQVRAVMERLKQQPDWPAFAGRRMIWEVLDEYPRREQVARELFDAATRALEGTFRDANRQIRDSKRLFGVPSAWGLLVLLNEGVTFLEPHVLQVRLSQLLRKKTPRGAWRFQDIDWVLVITWAHVARDSDGKRRMPFLSVTRPEVDPRGQLGPVEDFVMRQWAEFLGVPIEAGRPEDLEPPKVIGTRPPPAM